MQIEGLPPRCAYVHCRQHCSTNSIACRTHRCECSSNDIVALDRNGYYVELWERIHYVSGARVPYETVQKLRSLPLLSGAAHRSFCPMMSTMQLIPCSAAGRGMPVSDKCIGTLPAHYFDNTNMCHACYKRNRCLGRVATKRKGGAEDEQCSRLYDARDVHGRAPFQLCNNSECNVAKECANNQCINVVYKQVIRGSLHVATPVLCGDCSSVYCVCMGCGRTAVFGKTILFSNYLYVKNNKPQGRPLCINCTPDRSPPHLATPSRVALLLQWRVFRHIVDKWVNGEEEERRDVARFLLVNWTHYTPLERWFMVRDDWATARSVMRYRAPVGDDSVGALMYWAACLPRDVFGVVVTCLWSESPPLRGGDSGQSKVTTRSRKATDMFY